MASVGFTEPEAKAKFGDIETYEYNLGGNGKSQILATAGFIKLVRQKDGPVVGVHMVGSRVGELIGEGQLIANWEAYPEDVAALVHAHPTQNEAMGEAHLALAGKPSTRTPDSKGDNYGDVGHDAPTRRERHRGNCHPLVRRGRRRSHRR